MNISSQGTLIKNISIAFFNGLITLILLLIAPLGLATVIFNTLAITISSFAVATLFDKITEWLITSARLKTLDKSLSNHPIPDNLLPNPDKNKIDRIDR